MEAMDDREHRAIGERSPLAESTGNGAEFAGPVSLDVIQREYLDDLRHRTSPMHHMNVRGRLKRTLAALDAVYAHDIRPLAVIRYRNQMRERGASNRTANLVVDSLRAMLTWAVGCRLVDGNPLGAIPRLPDGSGYQRYRRRALTEKEVGAFLRAAEGDDRDTAARWRSDGGGKGDHRRSATRVPQAPMWRAFVETGARWSELTRVRWMDVDRKRRTLMLRAENTKSRRQRVLPLGKGMLEVLGELRRLHRRILHRPVGELDPVFRTPEAACWGRPTNNAMRIFNRLLARAKIERVDGDGRKIDIHALRHTFGSRLARHGAGLVQVQRLMGHSDPKLTAQVYTHLDVEDLRKALEMVAEA